MLTKQLSGVDQMLCQPQVTSSMHHVHIKVEAHSQ